MTETTMPAAPAVPAAAEPVLPSLREAMKLWAYVGVMSFGGPAGQIALMHRELVEKRRWIGEARFLHALNYCMLLPGPEAQQLATYVGWLMHRTAGGLAAGLLFVLPGALVMLALSLVYVIWRDVPLVDAMFFGIKAAVFAVVVEAVLRIGRRALKTRASLVVAALSFLGIAVFHLPFPLIVFGAGLAGWLAGRHRPGLFGAGGGKGAGEGDPPGLVDRLIERGDLDHVRPSRRRALGVLATWLPIWLGPLALLAVLLGPDAFWSRLAGFFSLMAVVTFGGAYAVLAYVAQAAVDGFGWLRPGEMIDGLGLAETTPGPLILVLQFVGFLAAHRSGEGLDPLLAGTLGALLTTWVTFAPCFLWVFLGGPYVEALRGNRALATALAAITAAVVGVVLNLALWFAMHVIFAEVHSYRIAGIGPDLPVLASIDWRAAVLAVAAMVAMLRFHVGLAPVLLASAFAGVALTYLPG